MKTFYKLSASGNDFVLMDSLGTAPQSSALKKLAVRLCERKSGIGADGLLVIEKSGKADFRMRIFNPDGTEAEMCGNGARCSALWFFLKKSGKKVLVFETLAGMIEAERAGNRVRIKMTPPTHKAMGIKLEAAGRRVALDFVNTGVPHAVVIVPDIKKADLLKTAPALRYHRHFAPAGTNVDFVQHLGGNRIAVRTYERGVEGETLACGTGAAASAIISLERFNIGGKKNRGRVDALVKSGEKLSVYFERENSLLKNVWLEGPAVLVFTAMVER